MGSRHPTKGLNNGYSNWANEDKAKDPEQFGDGALIKTGTQAQPNGQWKQQFYQKTNGANKVMFSNFESSL